MIVLTILKWFILFESFCVLMAIFCMQTYDLYNGLPKQKYFKIFDILMWIFALLSFPILYCVVKTIEFVVKKES